MEKGNTSTISSRCGPQRGISKGENKSWATIALLSITGVALALCCVLSSDPVASWISLALFFACLLFICFTRPEFFFKYFIFLFAVLSNTLGCLSVEFGHLYLSRLGCITGFEGSLPLLVFSRWLFVAVLLAFDAATGMEKRGISIQPASMRGRKWVRVCTFVTLGITILCFLTVIDKPSFLTGLNRFEYVENELPGIFRYLTRSLLFLVVFPIMAIRDGDKKLGIVTIGLYCIYLFWTGTKFGTFLAIVSILALVYYDKIILLGKQKLIKLLGLLAVVVLALVGVAVVSHSFTSTVPAGDYLAERFAGDGELWWRTYALYGESAHPEAFSNELEAIAEGKTGISENVGSKNGIYGIMYLTAPRSTVDSVLSQGWRFTEAGYAAAYYYFGAPGTIAFSLLMGIVVGLVTNSFITALFARKTVRSLILAYYYSITQTALSMFLFVPYFQPISICMLAFLAIDHLVSSGSNNEKRLRRKAISCSKGHVES